MVFVTLPSFKEYKMVVFPAESSPSINIFEFCFNILAELKIFLKILPIFYIIPDLDCL